MWKLGLIIASLCVAGAVPAEAQSLGPLQPSAAGPPSNPEYGGGIPIGSNVDPNRVSVTRDTWASRRRDRRRSDEATAAAPPQVREAAERLVAAAGLDCALVDAALRVTREDGTRLYEVACDGGPGYLIEDLRSGARAQDCVLQWSAAELGRREGQPFDESQLCNLAANPDPVDVIAGYGREAGVQCDVDEALATAENVYEIGCSDRDGWRLERRGSAWKTTSCWEFRLRSDATCRFSGEADARAQWPGLVVGTDVSGCVPDAVAWMGDNAQRGAFYEVRCSTGDGFLVQFKDGATQRTFPCSEAPRIFRKPCSLSAPEA
ncbi:MAG TPA: hypothetical protein VGR32_08405 [Brevundimonas sp.]|jgi:hypothetical protein|uniref:hypothetical protein n=1 Tax=Brevundimonas sp. TaxID=1871086 RepID=UPI002DEF7EBF|nr:hypothetical protein [Brevundimonas sp.]